MKAFKAIAVIGLLATALGPILMFTGSIDLDTNKLVMLAGMIVWFIGGIPCLSSNKLQPTDSEVEI